MRFWLCCTILAGLAATARAEDALRIVGPEQSHLSDQFPDGGLPPVVGVQNFCVFRSSRYAPEITDGKGWTYNHHIDICSWAGRLYVAWENGQRDEDTWPARQVFSTSADGFTWSPPAELFPFGSTNATRMYFYHAANGHMLAIAARRITHDKITDVARSGLLVREILPDHSLGPVFVLTKSPAADASIPFFADSTNPALFQACNQLLADHTFLEQQDFGELLGDQRMKGFNLEPNDFGKAFCFFHRPDGALVGICKVGYVVTSFDNGLTWSNPTQLQDFKAGTAKEWVQQTRDGKFAWAHDPFHIDRFPLVIMTGADGVTFSDTRVVHGEVPRQRYEGLNKNIGPQYVRGISFWNSDGSRTENAIWLAYSVNKEDIWVSRIPLPIRAQGDQQVNDDFRNFQLGCQIPGWNTYVPKWADVSIAPTGTGNQLRIEDHDPYDYARADRVFSPRSKLTADFQLTPNHLGSGDLEIELWTEYGDTRPIRIALLPDGKIKSASTTIGDYSIGKPIKFTVTADTTADHFTVSINNGSPTNIAFAEKPAPLNRIVFRTDKYRLLPTRGDEIPQGTDRPTDSSEYSLSNLTIR